MWLELFSSKAIWKASDTAPGRQRRDQQSMAVITTMPRWHFRKCQPSWQQLVDEWVDKCPWRCSSHSSIDQIDACTTLNEINTACMNVQPMRVRVPSGNEH